MRVCYDHITGSLSSLISGGRVWWSWQSPPVLPSLQVDCSASVIAHQSSGLIIVAGGYSSMPFIHFYDPIANIWLANSNTSSLSAPRVGISTAQLGDWVYFIGGGNNAADSETHRIDIINARTKQQIGQVLPYAIAHDGN